MAADRNGFIQWDRGFAIHSDTEETANGDDDDFYIMNGNYHANGDGTTMNGEQTSSCCSDDFELPAMQDNGCSQTIDEADENSVQIFDRWRRRIDVDTAVEDMFVHVVDRFLMDIVHDYCSYVEELVRREEPLSSTGDDECEFDLNDEEFKKQLYELANPITNPAEKVTCLSCDRPVLASRFTYHLEKCIGNGRISSRIARQKLEGSISSGSKGSPSSNSKESDILNGLDVSDEDKDNPDDDDWVSARDKRRGRNRKTKRRKKIVKKL